ALADLVSMREAATLAGVHRNTIRTWCAAGRLPYVRVNRRGDRRFRRSDVERLAVERRVPARSERAGPLSAVPAGPSPGTAGRSARRIGIASRSGSRADALRRIAADI